MPGLGETFWLLAIGLAAGLLGGMLGIGGSLVMIPLLTVFLGKNHHISQAVAMIVNLFVAAPALISHDRAKAVQWQLVGRLLPAGTTFILLGVMASNLITAERLEAIFGVFLLYVILTNVVQLKQHSDDTPVHHQRRGWAVISAVAAITGFMSGLLGIGGGLVAVPLLQRICRLPLRQSIATTAAMMCVTATVGAVLKNATLPSHVDEFGLPLSINQCLMLAAYLAPTAVIGGLFGARLTHTLPLPVVRLVFIVLMLWSASDMLGISHAVTRILAPNHE